MKGPRFAAFSIRPFSPNTPLIMLDANIKSQLQSYFAKLARPVEFKAVLDDSESARNMNDLLREVAELSPLLSYSAEAANGERAPSFTIGAQGAAAGIRFACLPMGHEFTGFILAILQSGGHPPRITDEQRAQIERLKGPLNFEIFISLSCHNCPEVVQALNTMAVLNPGVKVTVIDGALFQQEAADRRVMAVPTVFLNGESFISGRHELSEIIEKLDSQAASEAAAALSAKPPFDVLVVGAGPAGTTAAIYAARKGVRTGMLAERPGGQVMETLEIENFTSVKRQSGSELGNNMMQHVHEYDIDVMAPKRAAGVDRDGDLWCVKTEDGGEVKTKTLIIATGARWKKLGVPGEIEYTGKGVAYCPHCDGPFFKGKRIAVVGGGNSGVEAAIDLAGICAHVTVIQRRDRLVADQVLQDKLRSLPNVDIRLNAQTTSLEGVDGRLSTLRYKDRTSGDEWALPVDGCFVQIGLQPNTEWMGETIERNGFGELVVNARCETAYPGVFGAGDCTNVPYKQVVIGLGEGAKASLSAFDYLIRH